MRDRGVAGVLGRFRGPSRARRRPAGREHLVTPRTGAWTPGQTPGPYACLVNAPRKGRRTGMDATPGLLSPLTPDRRSRTIRDGVSIHQPTGAKTQAEPACSAGVGGVSKVGSPDNAVAWRLGAS